MELKDMDRFIDINTDASAKINRLQLETSPFVK